MTKLNSLEGKIKEYLKLKYPQSLTNKEHIKTAHDIAEICEKEWQDRIDCEKCNNLQDENATLKILLVDKDKEIVEYELINNHHVDLIGRQEQQLADEIRNNKIIMLDADQIKAKLAEIKYLDRNEVWDLVFKYPADEIDEKELVDNICNLAYKPITKDKIIKALVKHSAIEEIELKNGGTVAYRVIGQAGFEQIANEIIDKDNLQINN